MRWKRPVTQLSMITAPKRLLGNKYILAQILVYTVDEFKGMQPMDVVPLIEGEPKIGIVPVEPGLTNERQGDKIIGLNTENTEEKEALYDLTLYFTLEWEMDSHRSLSMWKHRRMILMSMIFWIELFSMSVGMVSSQKERDFVHQHYNDIKKLLNLGVHE